MRVKAKMFAAFLSIAVLTGLVGLVGGFTADRLGKEGVRVAERLAPLGDAAMEIKLTATRAHLIFEEIMAGDEGEDVQAVWGLLDETLFYVDAILHGGENDEGTFHASQDPAVRAKIEGVRGKVERFIEAARVRHATMRDVQAQEGLDDAAFDESFEGFIAEADEAEGLIHAQMAASVAALRADSGRGVTLITVAALLTFGLAAVAAVLIGRNVSGRIDSLASAMEKIAAGDLAIGVPHVKSKDEIGVMARTVEVFKDNGVERGRLESERFGLDEERAGRVAAIEALIAAFDEDAGKSLATVQGAAEALTAVSTQISACVDEATHNVETVAAASRDLSASITEVEANTTASRTIANNAVTEVTNAANAYKELNAATQQINSIVALIGDIAEQTNLLALNATIEAARAGEAGRGFSVVAGEVKALAERTGQATTDINKCIQEVQHSTGTATSAMDAITAIIAEIDRRALGVADGVNQQSQTTADIAANAQSAAGATLRVVQSVKGDQGTAASTSILGATDKLQQNFSSLQKRIETFLGDIRAA